MRFTSRLALILAVAVVCAAFASEALAGPGAFVWKKSSDPSAGTDDLSLCARGPGGAVYAAGYEGVSPAAGIWVVKYKAGGAQAWSKKWAGPDGLVDRALGMAVDRAGNVYVCGSTGRSSTFTDSVLLKYSSGGTLRWGRVYTYSPRSDEFDAVAVDKAGNVYVAGWREPSTTQTILLMGKYGASDGDVLWSLGQQVQGGSSAEDVAVTTSGVCYVAGRMETAPESGVYDAVLWRGHAGHPDWLKMWNGPGGGSDVWNQVELCPKGGATVAGAAHEDGAGDLACARYAASGKRLWARTWSSPGSWSDRCRGLAVARDGSAWVVGLTDREEGDWRAAIVKWSASGRRPAAHTMGTSKSSADFEAVTVDASGNAYAAGTRAMSSGGWNLLAVKYAPSGRLLWRSTAGLGANSQDSLEAVCLGPAGYLYATGGAGWEDADSRGVVVKIRR